MKDSTYNAMISIIKAVRDYDSFTLKTVVATTNLTCHQSREAMYKLRDINAVRHLSGSKVKFVVSDNAIQLISKYRAKESEEKKSKKAVKVDKYYDFSCKMNVVKKANVKGLGNSFLKQFNELLGGVRA